MRPGTAAEDLSARAVPERRDIKIPPSGADEMRRVLCLGILLPGLCSGLYAGAAATQAGPPKDDLIWMESAHDAKALAWAKQHTDRTITNLQALADFPRVKTELARLLENQLAQQPDVILQGHRAMRVLRDQEHPFGH